MKVLIVEDEPKTADYLERGLREQGYVVDVARDGREALEKLPVVRPDLVLLDYMMPRMNGGEFLAALRATPGLAPTPVLLLSAVPPRLLPALPFDAHLQKPFELQALLAQVVALAGPP